MKLVHWLYMASDWVLGLSYILIMAWLQWAIVLRPLIALALNIEGDIL
jgi:hypothetical protein